LFRWWNGRIEAGRGQPQDSGLSSLLMRRDPGLTPWDWELTPPAARYLLLALRQQVRLLRLRSTAYEQQIADLRQQLDTIDDLRAEIAELRERLGLTSQNSSRPPSSDPPSY